MKKILKRVAGVLAIFLFVVVAYVAYVFISYHRIEDKELLPVNQYAAKEQLESKKTYRISSANIGFGAYSDDYSFFMDGGKYSRAFSKEAVISNVKGSLQRVKDLKPDIALFQEVDIDGTRSYHVNQLRLLDTGFKTYSSAFALNYDSAYLLYPIQSPHGKNKAGIVTYSNVQAHNAIRRSLPIETGFSKFMDLDRCYTKEEIRVDNGKKLYIYNLHLSAYTLDPKTANNQLKKLFKDMGQEIDKGNYVIGGGDFNKDLLGDSYAVFQQGDKNVGNWAKPIPKKLIPDTIQLVAPLDEKDPVPSCRNADQPYSKKDFVLTIDGFVVSKNVTVKRAFVDKAEFKYSDHNPVAMDFELE